MSSCIATVFTVPCGQDVTAWDACNAVTAKVPMPKGIADIVSQDHPAPLDPSSKRVLHMEAHVAHRIDVSQAAVRLEAGIDCRAKSRDVSDADITELMKAVFARAASSPPAIVDFTGVEAIIAVTVYCDEGM